MHNLLQSLQRNVSDAVVTETYYFSQVLLPTSPLPNCCEIHVKSTPSTERLESPAGGSTQGLLGEEDER
ncbi:hypothetical protein BDV93DRAFT_522919 [Ceratobasidium sp. AG-I]|nr:hypothetical protein BDV93DRAFT_522919 [Ceratobasidium sp. AG-I]